MKGYVQDGKNIIRLPRQHLPLSDGPVLFRRPRREKRPFGPVLYRLCRYFIRRDRQSGASGDTAQTAGGRDFVCGQDRAKDDERRLPGV